MASMSDIKRRRSSIQSTQQITKAMKLVSTVKLQKAKIRAESSKPYFRGMYDTITSLLSKANSITHPYIVGNDSSEKALILISSNRGLAGGYNSNIIKKVVSEGFEPETTELYTIGKKGRDGLAHRGFTPVKDYQEMIESPQYADAAKVCSEITARYMAGEIGEIWLAYTFFKNTVVHEPHLIRLLPVDLDAARDEDGDRDDDVRAPMNFEQTDENAALEILVPKYLASMLYGAMIQAVASENGARMQAMDSATSNADEMISKLTLQYNRARQGSITQEITEIIGGAEAIN